MASLPQLLLILLLIALAAAVVLLSGCVSASSPQQGSGIGAGQQGGANLLQGGAASGQGNFTGGRFGNRAGAGFGNMTDAQRQQMLSQRMQQAKDACNGLASGSPCIMQAGPRGNATGNCQLQNGTLECVYQMNGRNAWNGTG